MAELREKIAAVIRQQLENAGVLSCNPSDITMEQAADEILAIEEIAEAQERIKELESNLEAWQYAAQYPEG